MATNHRAAAGRAVTSLVTALGWVYIADAVIFWKSSDPTHFLLYLCMGILAAVFMGRRIRGKTDFSANLFLVPLAIVELTLPETILLAVAGALVFAVASNGLRECLRLIVLSADEATAAAAASFAYHSLIPSGGETGVLRLFLGGGAYFVARTLPKAIHAATTHDRRIGRAWKQDHFWSLPFYLVGASAAGLLSIRNAFVHWEACVLVAPVLYVLFRAHQSRESTLELLRQRNREVEAARTAAESASRAKSEFLANVSHELRTPLHGIIGMTALALDGPLSYEARDCLQTAQGCSDALLRLLSEVLDFAKTEADMLELELVPFGLREHLDLVCRPFALTAANKGVKMHYEVSEELPDALTGDPHRLSQVVRNLLDNALKFTPNGEVKLSVSGTESVPHRALLHFVVQDTGIGVPADKQRAIFDPFTQADGSMTRRFGGTGLGLAICARLVEKMGGRMWVESEPGAGSAFHFTCDLALQAALCAKSAPSR